MVTQLKRNKKSQQKKKRPGVAAQRSRASTSSPLSPMRPKSKELPSARDEDVSGEDEEPRAEDLAAEEPIKPSEIEEATAAIKAAAEAASSEPRGRERSGYDG